MTARQDNTLYNPNQARVKKLLGGWSIKKLLGLLLIVLITIALLVLLIRLYRYSDYRLLYGHLSARDLTVVSQWLAEHNVEYKVDKDYRNIYIPAEHIHQSRTEMAMQQTPHDVDKGLDLLGHEAIIHPDYVGDREYFLAVQSELAETIGSFDQIRSARVQLNLGKKNTVIDRGPRATVILDITPGQMLASGQIRGIVHLLTASVPGLQPASIRVFDSSGILLPGDDWYDSANLFPADSFAYQKYIERNLENKAQEIVDTLLGGGQALVRVAAELDLSRTETISERYDPEETVIRSEHIQQEPASPPSSSSTEEAAAGVQSTGRYRPPVITSSEIDYEINKTTSTTSHPTGGIERLSVTILVAGRKQRADESFTSFTPRDEDALNSLKDSITTALPLRPERGDSIQMISVPAREDLAEPAIQAPLFLHEFMRYLPLLKVVLVFLGLLLLYILVIRPVIAVLTRDPADLRSDEDHQEHPPTEPEPVSKDEDAANFLKKEIYSHPAAAAHIIKKWMQET